MSTTSAASTNLPTAMAMLSEAAGFAGLPGVETFAAEFRDWPDVVAPPPPGWSVADWQLHARAR